MSNLVPYLLNLDKGLNLQTAKIVAPEGSVLDTLNYEQVDFQGQKRIDGYTRYDGTSLAILDEYKVVTVSGNPTLTDGSLIFTDDDTLYGTVVGSAVSGPDTLMYVATINYNVVLVASDALAVKAYDAFGNPTTTNVTVISSVDGLDSGVTAEVHYQNLLAFSEVLRTKVESLLGPIAGLHWFRDRLYAVAGLVVLALEGTTPLLHPNDEVTADDGDSNQAAHVLDSFVVGDFRYVWLNTDDAAFWQQEGLEVFVNAVSVGLVAGIPLVDDNTDIASLFESRTEQQALDEDGIAGPVDFGWRIVHQGWEVGFEDGLSLFGSLPSLNQNLEGLGVQGPTSTTGNNGRPLTLLQKINITNGQVQVNGWKSSQTPTSYLLDPDNLTDIDSDYIYADAFFSWDGTTGQVSQPGITTSTLPEYSATATVEVDV